MFLQTIWQRCDSLGTYKSNFSLSSGSPIYLYLLLPMLLCYYLIGAHSIIFNSVSISLKLPNRFCDSLAALHVTAICLVVTKSFLTCETFARLAYQIEMFNIVMVFVCLVTGFLRMSCDPWVLLGNFEVLLQPPWELAKISTLKVHQEETVSRFLKGS